MAPFPPPPVSTIEWTNTDNLKFHEAIGHIESTYSRATGKWTPLKFVKDPYLRMHGMAPALNYGQQCLEGLKAFRTPSGVAVFRPERNAQRFQHSAEVLSMPPVPTELFVAACRAAVALNAAYAPPHDSGGALYVRPLLLGTGALLPPSPAEDYAFLVFVAPTPAGVHDAPLPARALVLDEFDRAAPRGTGHAKVGGNYAPVLRFSGAARASGFGITLHLDSARHEEVDEFSTCGFIGVRTRSPPGGGPPGSGGVTLVVPDSPCVIDSVTSDSVQQIARDACGWGVERRRIAYTELPEFSEVLGAGTGVALCPIRSITRRTSGAKGLCNGSANGLANGLYSGPSVQKLPAGPRVVSDADSETVTYLDDEQESGGPVFLELLKRLKDIQLGKAKDEFGWLSLVRAEDGAIDGGNEE
ncbi:hypothetical protein INS49_005349 [Diaporthe citri]|uniref:uncharacterized protein n=1 Tax=Diaporthe citri TaxID=83186 RepID=UPI001C8277DA|nr:uncharacterized protein INS49_005349 [Diaporthe citri]KAG6353641.1 hypothetical protein INS49_005349 [Diaporthe citri]